MSALKITHRLFLLICASFVFNNTRAQTFEFRSPTAESPTIMGQLYKDWINITSNSYVDEFGPNSTYTLTSGPCSWAMSPTPPAYIGEDRVQAMVPIDGLSLNYDFKELRAFVDIRIDHDEAVDKKYNPYVYIFKINVKCFKSTTNCSSPSSFDPFTEYLMVSYLPDGTYAYQDISQKSYYGYYSIQAQIENIYDVTNFYYGVASTSGGPIDQLEIKNALSVKYAATNSNCSSTVTDNAGILIYSNGFRDLVSPLPSSCLNTNWKLKVGIEYQKFVKSIPSGNPSNIYSNTMAGITLEPTHALLPNDNALHVSWDPNPGMQNGAIPAMFELEWTYIDDYQVSNTGGVISVSEKPASSLEYNFKESATRIITEKVWYDIPLIYKRGYLVYRVRMLRPDQSGYEKTKYSDWSLGSSEGLISNISSSISAYYKITSPHVADKQNWNYQVSFAEQGKSKHVLSYFDGLLKNRQSVTKFGSIPNQLIVTEPVYNYEGNVALQFLPIPVIKPISADHSLTYQEDFLSGTEYQASNIDNLASPINSSHLLNSLSTTNSSSKYYSSNNLLLGSTFGPERLMVKAIPDAEGFPLIHTKYDKHDPRKIKMQGGAGKALQIGKGHETIFSYMDPTQTEINKYFGLNIGLSNFYEKTVTRDPNNQLSFSISNNKGQPVMTGLMKKPDNLPINGPIVPLDKLDMSQSVELTTDLLSGLTKQWQGNVLKYSKTYYAETNLNKFVYNMKLEPFDACSTAAETNDLFTVPLDLTVKVTNDAESTYTIYPTTKNNMPPTTGTYSSSFSEVSQNIGVPGETTAEYTLSYEPKDVEAAVDNYLSSFANPAFSPSIPATPPPGGSCIKPYSDYLNNAISNLPEICNYESDEIYSECKEYLNLIKMQMQLGEGYSQYNAFGEKNTILGLSTVANNESIFNIVNWTYNGVPCSTLTNPVSAYSDFDLTIKPDPIATPSYASIINAACSAANNAVNEVEYSLKMGAYLDILYELGYRPVYVFQQSSPIGTLTVPGIVPVTTYASFSAKDLIDNAELVEDDLAKMHPEYCLLDLLYCDNEEGMAFIDKLKSVEDYSIAEQLKMLTFDDLVLKDPAAPWYNSHSSFLYTEQFNLPLDDNNGSLGIELPCYSGTPYTLSELRIDIYARLLTKLYFEPNTSFCDAINDPNSWSAWLVGSSAKVKDKYYETFKSLYLLKRTQVMQNVVPMVPMVSCGAVIALVPELAIFKALLPNNLSSQEIADNATQLASYNNGISFVNPNHANEVAAAQNSLDESYVSSIINSLSNCVCMSSPPPGNIVFANSTASNISPYSNLFPSTYYSGLPAPSSRSDILKNDIIACLRMNRNTSVEKIWKGGITPDMMKDILTKREFILDDLCNPYLIDYELSTNGLLETELCDLNEIWQDLSKTTSGMHQLPANHCDIKEILNGSSLVSGTYTISLASIPSGSSSNKLDYLLYHSLGLQQEVSPIVTLDWSFSSATGLVNNLIGSPAFSTSRFPSPPTAATEDKKPLNIEYILTNNKNSKTVKFTFSPDDDISANPFAQYNGLYRSNYSVSSIPSLIPTIGSLILSNENLGGLFTNNIFQLGANSSQSGQWYFTNCNPEFLADGRIKLKVFYYDGNDKITPTYTHEPEEYFYTFNLIIDGLDLYQESTCISAYEMKRDYKKFEDDVQIGYGIKGLGHPYYEKAVENFFNYRYRKEHTADEYVGLMKGINLGEQFLLPAYFGYFKAEGPTAEINAIINWCQNPTVPGIQSLTNMEYVRYEVSGSGTDYLYIDFKSVYKDGKLRQFIHALKNFLIPGTTTYPNSGNYLGTAFSFNKLEFLNYTDVFVSDASYTSPSIPFTTKIETPVDLKLSPSLDILPSPPPVMQPVIHKFKRIRYLYDIPADDNQKSKSLYLIEKNYKDLAPTLSYHILSSLQSTMNLENLNPDKLGYLGKAKFTNVLPPYNSITPLPTNYVEMIEPVRKTNLLSNLFNASSGYTNYNNTGDYISYLNPLEQGSGGVKANEEPNFLSGRLYLYDKLASYNEDGLNFLNTVLTSMRRVNLSPPNFILSTGAPCIHPSSIFYDNNDYDVATNSFKNLNITSGAFTGNYIISPRRQAENIFWYKIRKDNPGTTPDAFFNIYIKVPDYLTLADLRSYTITGVSPILIKGGAKALKVIFTSDNTYSGTCMAANEFTAYGRVDFNLNNASETVFENVMLCDGDEPSDLFNPCFENQIAEAEQKAKAEFRVYIENKRTELLSSANEHIKNKLEPFFSVKMEQMKYALTLYGYDRAGNLIYTVPPEGVKSIPTQTNLDAIEAARKSPQYKTIPSTVILTPPNVPIPAHTKKSTYTYNSTNQLVTQNTPDGGETKFYYDPAGKLVFSQNAKQAAKSIPRASYTLYDKQNRIIETGELEIPYGNDVYTLINTRLKDYTFDIPELLEDANGYILNMVHHHGRYEVVRTFYDSPLYEFATSTNGMSLQENLRGRVSAITNYNYCGSVGVSNTDNPLSFYNVALHYSYDLSGNVKTLTYDMPELAYLNQKFKRIDYDFDLYSGKVNLVSYNRGFTDQYYQKYQYDEDNRITKTQTSQDGILWDRDAEYNYYPHGPLAKIKLGDLGVQGIDFAYTLQGWLKSINGDVRDPARDIGGDDHVLGTELKADLLNHSLYYYDSDYKPIETGNIDNTSEQYFITSTPTNRDLYNGNISATNTAPGQFESLHTEYWYDQLNRIKRAEYRFPDYLATGSYSDKLKLFSEFANGGILSTTGQPSGLHQDSLYRSEYYYDFDGNIEKLRRFAPYIPSTSLVSNIKNNSDAKVYLMDNINYNYADQNINNKLDNYTEDVNHALSTSFTNDLQPYSLPNLGAKGFSFDLIGNLISDQSNTNPINNIDWSLYGKVKGMSFGDGKQLVFGYEPTGSRFKKTSISNSAGLLMHYNEYYIRDASSNILAIYKQKQEFASLHPIKDVMNGILSHPAFSQSMADIVGGNFEFNHNAATQLASEQITYSQNLTSTENIGFYLRNSSEIRTSLIQNRESIISELLSIDASTISDLFVDFNSNLLMPMMLEPDPDVSSEFIALLVDQNDIVGQKALCQAFDENASIESLAEFVTFIKAAILNNSMNDFFVILQSYYSENTDKWNTALTQILASGGYMPKQYPTFSFGSCNNYCKTILTENGDIDKLESYFNSLSDASSLLNGASTVSQRLETLLNKNPFQVFTSLKSQSFASELLENTFLATSSISFSSLCAKLVAGPLGYSTEATLATILNKEKYYLAEHHLYGSSRLGIKNYWPTHYNFVFDKDGGVNNSTWAAELASNELLSKKRPWFSSLYNSLIKAGKTTLAGNQNTDQLISSRLLGQKDYELTNHLGNVMSVVLDKVIEKEDAGTATYFPVGSATLQEPTPAKQMASLRASYDYYPFGMLMPHRYSEDNTEVCAPVTFSSYVPYIIPDEVIQFNQASAVNLFATTQGCNLGVDLEVQNLVISAASTVANINVSTEFSNRIANKNVILEFPMTNLAQNLVVIELQQLSADNTWVVLASTSVSYTAAVKLEAMSINNNNMRLMLKTRDGADMRIGTISLKTMDIFAGSVTKLICNKDPFFNNDYRFGFNGQEKDNEVAGIGNHNTAKFWEYDTRLGRRWNLDPVDQISISNYATFGNNPIRFNDIQGNKFDEADNSKKIAMQKRADAVTNSNSLSNKLNSVGNQLKNTNLSEKQRADLKEEFANLESLKGEFDQMVTEIDQMEASNQLYRLKPKFNGPNILIIFEKGKSRKNIGGTYYSNGAVVMEYDPFETGSVEHELKHGSQFETGKISFNIDGTPGILYDRTDEESAYRRQAAMTTIPGRPILSIVPDTKIYSELPKIDLNINTSVRMFDSGNGYNDSMSDHDENKKFSESKFAEEQNQIFNK